MLIASRVVSSHLDLRFFEKFIIGLAKSGIFDGLPLPLGLNRFLAVKILSTAFLFCSLVPLLFKVGPHKSSAFNSLIASPYSLPHTSGLFTNSCNNLYAFFCSGDALS